MAEAALRCAVRRYSEAIRTGRKLYRADNPLAVQVTTAAPRLVMQCIFLTLAGRVLSGRSGAIYAFTGSVAYAACSQTVIFVCDIPMTDIWCGTYFRLRIGAIRPAAIYLCRVPPYLASGFLFSLLVLTLVGPALGLTRTSLHLLPLLPVYAVIACSSAAFGLAIAALAAGGGHDVLLGNLATFAILGTAGVVTPYPPATHWLTRIGQFLPVSHGLAAIREHMAGHPSGGQAVLEALTGACWLVVSIIVLHIQDRRAARRPLVRGGRVPIERTHPPTISQSDVP